MTAGIIITLCVLLLIAYIFDLTGARTKIPSVILLLLLGWLVRQISKFVGIEIPNLTPLLPILGTIGLVLIVLEGSLELELDKSKAPMIRKSFFMALLPLVIMAFGLTYAFHYFSGTSLKDSLTNAIPFCVISSAIAIPSVRYLSSANKEFIIYESSLSDILGVLMFNFFALNATINFSSFGYFALQLLIIIVVSFIATVGLSFLIGRIEHNIKFAPIILLVILIYEISKIYHLPGLLFILLFGLFLGNLDELKHNKWIQKLRPEILNREVRKFKEITTEAVFLIRSLFFLLFGYLIRTSEIINIETLVWAVGIVAGVFLIRFLFLKMARLPVSPLIFVAPRGLITILLFFSIPVTQAIPIVNNSLIIQVIILSALVMMFGLMSVKKPVKGVNSMAAE
ncbi:MAG: sodium:proton antiporter [Sphingobacteriales bacterium]|nr:MAG: sodium:proton antiporter [Sphingobacteriales bacterium]